MASEEREAGCGRGGGKDQGGVRGKGKTEAGTDDAKCDGTGRGAGGARLGRPG